MPVGFNIQDGTGSEFLARVTSNGELIIRPFEYDTAKYIELGTANTAYNFEGPKAGQFMVITTIVLKADRQVSNSTDADVVIYEASSATSTTVDRVLFQTAMIVGDQVQLSGLRIKVNKGKWVNAKTTDDDIHATLAGFFVPIEEG